MQKLLLAFSLFLFVFSSCRKDSQQTELRTKVYPLRAYNNSGVSGQVSFIETSNKDSILVKLEASGLRLDTLYLSHLHTGTPGNLTGTLIYFHNLRTYTGSITHEEKWGETFDNALLSNTCFTMHNPDFFSNDTIGYALAGGLGANGTP